MDKWSIQLDGITSGFIENFGSLTSADLNWKPDPGTWSIAQNIDHLMVINRSYFPLLDKLRSGRYKTPFIGRLGFVVTLMGNMILKAVDPDRKRRTRTFPIWQPAEVQQTSHILEQFKGHQEELKQRIAESENLVASGAVVASPANRNVVYTLEKAFDILVSHELRHLNQSKEILARLKKEKTVRLQDKV